MTNPLLVENPRLWDGLFQRAVTHRFRIAICTTCMNRLDDLRQTLPENIAANADYENLEFCLLDYNSGDGLSDWVRQHFSREIAAGRLRYFRTEEPQFYEMGHSRNLAFALADADIVTNVDADNWATAGFAAQLNRIANQLPDDAVFVKSWQRMNGRIGMYKKEWQLLGGYDESFVGYGFDDADLVSRALLKGSTLARFGGEYCRRIHTSEPDKVANLENKGWRKTQSHNRKRAEQRILAGCWKANEGRAWGRGEVVCNFSERLRVSEGSYQPLTEADSLASR